MKIYFNYFLLQVFLLVKVIYIRKVRTPMGTVLVEQLKARLNKIENRGKKSAGVIRKLKRQIRNLENK